MTSVSKWCNKKRPTLLQTVYQPTLKSNQGYRMKIQQNLLIVDLTKKLKFQASYPEIHAKFRNILALEKGKRTHKKTSLV